MVWNKDRVIRGLLIYIEGFLLFQNYCFSKTISKLFLHSHNHALHWAMWGRAFINPAVECREINDFRVKGHRVSQIHINNQTNSLRTRDCAMSKTHSLLLLLCLHNWTESIYDHSRDLRPVQQLGRLPLITTSPIGASMDLDHFSKLMRVFVLLVFSLVWCY